jgi:hypothetical protein
MPARMHVGALALAAPHPVAGSLAVLTPFEKVAQPRHPGIDARNIARIAPPNVSLPFRPECAAWREAETGFTNEGLA